MIVLLNLTRSTTDPRAIPVTCAKCHSSAGHLNVHYLAAAATEYGTQVKGGYEYDRQTYDGELVHPTPYDNCALFRNRHTSQLDVQDCGSCHSGVKTVEDVAKIRMSGSLEDYNGNGDVPEGVAAEVAGMQVKLLAAIQSDAKDVSKAAIVYDGNTYPYFFGDADGNSKVDEGEEAYTEWTPRLLQAAYNYQHAQKELGLYAHNPKLGAQILFDALEELGKGGIKVDVTGMVRPVAAAQ